MAMNISSEVVTEGIRIRVSPRFLEAESSPEDRRYVFAYHITIMNEGVERVRLQSRHWIIVDSDGRRRDVEGLGVVGKQPVLAAGQRFEYSSYCPLETPWGTMEGSFLMEREAGQTFRAQVSRFYLVSQSMTPAPTAVG